MPATIHQRRLVRDIVCPRRLQDFSPPSDSVSEHATAVLAECIVELWCRNTITVLQHRIQSHPVVFLRQVLTDSNHTRPMTKQFAIGVVVAFAPRYASSAHACHRRCNRALPARKFVGIAADVSS